MAISPNPYDPLKPYRRALTAFVSCIEATGGCTRDHDGYIVPMVDEDWSDLGDAYVEACAALDREPLITTSEGVE